MTTLHFKDEFPVLVTFNPDKPEEVYVSSMFTTEDAAEEYIRTMRAHKNIDILRGWNNVTESWREDVTGDDGSRNPNPGPLDRMLK